MMPLTLLMGTIRLLSVSRTPQGIGETDVCMDEKAVCDATEGD